MALHAIERHIPAKSALLLGAGADALTTYIGIYHMHFSEGNSWASGLISHYETPGILAIKAVSMIAAMGISIYLEERKGKRQNLTAKNDRFDSAKTALMLGNIAQWGAVGLNTLQILLSV